MSISGVGDVSVWDFSGHEDYFCVYDHFIGNSTCIHLVVFPLHLPFHIQLQQTTFWLSFLQARLPPTEPLGKGLRLSLIIISFKGVFNREISCFIFLLDFYFNHILKPNFLSRGFFYQKELIQVFWDRV